MSEPRSLTLYSSWRGLLGGIITPALLIGFAAVSMVVAGRIAIVAMVVLALGLLFLAVTLADMPRHCRLDADGIHRRCLIRSQHLPWERVKALTRAPGPLLSLSRSRPGRRPGRSPGGLTALVGRRRYLLVDVAESTDEYDEIVHSLQTWQPDIPLLAARPFDNTPPTWLYHDKGRGGGPGATG